MGKRVLVLIGQLIILNILYLVIVIFSLGILLIPATSTLFHFIKKLRDDTYDPYDTIKPFFKKLIENTKKSMNIQLLFMALVFFCSFNILNSDRMTYAPIIKSTLLVFYAIVIVESLIIGLMASYLLANYVFEKESDILKMSFYLVHRHLITTLVIIIVLVMLGFIFYTYTIFMALLGVFSLLIYLLDILYTPISRRYQIKKGD